MAFASREAEKDYKKAWYIRNRDRILRERRRYAQENAAKISRYQHDYRARNQAALQAASRIRTMSYRAKKRAQFVEDVDPDVVYRMHGGMCGICKQFVPEDDFHVDHVVPVSKGGLHGYINVQPAHPLCNLKKGARV